MIYSVYCRLGTDLPWWRHRAGLNEAEAEALVADLARRGIVAQVVIELVA